MALTARELITPMLGAMRPILKKGWAEARDYAEIESKKMAATLAKITELRVAGKIDDQQADALVEMQKQAMQAVLLAVEGIGLVTAQKAIAAALDAVKGVVNKAIGFSLL